MNKLEDVSAERLRDELVDVSDAKATKRLMITLAYKDGESVATMSERYGILMATLYSWLDRSNRKRSPRWLRVISGRALTTPRLRTDTTPTTGRQT